MTIEERLENLEKELADAKRSNRWLHTVVGLVIVGLGLAWLLTKATVSATAATISKEIRANSFIVVDANGKERAVLRMDENGPRLDLADEKGNLRAELSLDKNAPGLGLYGENGENRASLAVTKNGSGLALLNEKGKIRVGMAMNALTAKPMMTLKDENGKVIWKAP